MRLTESAKGKRTPRTDNTTTQVTSVLCRGKEGILGPRMLRPEFPTRLWTSLAGDH